MSENENKPAKPTFWQQVGRLFGKLSPAEEVKRGTLEELKAKHIVPALQEIESNGPLRKLYFEKLANLHDQAAIDKFCEVAMFEAETYPAAVQIARRKSYAHSNIYMRSLYYYLTEQWQNYTELEAEIRATDNFAGLYARQEVLRKAANLGRKVGRSDLAKELMAAKSRAKNLKVVAGQEQELFEQLSEQAAWPELWRLVGEWSPVGSKLVLAKLAAARWQPTDPQEISTFQKLRHLAQNCSAEPTFGAYKLSRRYPLAPEYNHTNDSFSPIMSQTGVIADFLWDNHQIVFYAADNGNAFGEVPDLPQSSFNIFFAALSPDGSRLAYVKLNYVNNEPSTATVYVIDTKNQTPLAAITLDDFSLIRLAFFPDNRLLLYARSGYQKYSYWAYDLPTGERTEILEGLPHIGVRELCISPNGLFIAARDDCDTLWVWSIPEKQLIVSLTNLPPHGIIGKMCFSPDSLYLAYPTLDSAKILDIQTGKTIQTIRTGNSYCIYFLKFSPDGQFLLTGQADTGQVIFWRITDLEPVTEFVVEGTSVSNIIFDYNGVHLLALTNDRQLLAYKQEYRAILERPLAKNSPQDLAWLEERLADSEISKEERVWLEFTVALLKYRWQHAVLVDDVSELKAEPSDIEVEE